MTTILDVAREANVSPSTVSRVLNNSGAISKATVETVYKAVEKLGYEPNVFARNLRKRETHVLMILAPNMTNPYYASIIAGISDFTRELNYSCFICKTDGDSYQIKELLSKVLKHQADGAILLACEKDEKWLNEYRNAFPLVECSEYDPEIEIPHVCIDNFKAANEAVKYLISLGHRKIATISSVNKHISTELRMNGYLDALREAGIEIDDRYIAYSSVDYSYQSGCNETRRLLSQSNPPTALFCISDVLAVAAINTAKEMGFSVPEDFSVIGFDDVEMITMFAPKLTTVSQPCHEIGMIAATLLYRKIMQEGAVPIETILPHKLMIRETTRAPKGA